MKPPQYSFVPFAEGHLILLRNWLKQPHVAEFWQETADEEKLREKFLFGLRARGVEPFIAIRDQRPIGFIQYYEAIKVGGGWWPEETSGTFGVDQFIGEPDLLGQGIGTELMQTFLAQLFLNPAVRQVIVDPSPNNPRAIRMYEKAGFLRDRVLPTPGGEALLLRLFPPGTKLT